MPNRHRSGETRREISAEKIVIPRLASRRTMGPMSNGPDSRCSVEIHQAAGMVSIQADCELEQAYVLMSDRAAVARVSIEEIAMAVLDKSIRFGE